MGNKRREALAFRAITVSAGAAIRKASTLLEVESITQRADDLLADLAAAIVRDGGDAGVLKSIEHRRMRRLAG